jgi:hypothetical protein
MSSKSRRYEVLLPLQFNDGRDVPEEVLGEAVNEIVSQFNAASFRRDVIKRRCQYQETLHRDELACIEAEDGQESQVDEDVQGTLEGSA